MTSMQDNYKVRLDIFEGPLDLLLFLIKKNELDVYDIPVSFITEQYLAYLGMMQVLDVELASEFLIMAATLLEIKARMLLPVPEEPGEEPEDPRLELTNRLLEYQRYKSAAMQLNGLSLLYRDTFPRGMHEDVESEDASTNIEADPYDLFIAFRAILDRAKGGKVAYMTVEKVSVAQKVNEIIEHIFQVKSATLDTLFPRDFTRIDVVITILAVLELLRLRMLRCEQKEPFGPIWLYAQE